MHAYCNFLCGFKLIVEDRRGAQGLTYFFDPSSTSQSIIDVIEMMGRAFGSGYASAMSRWWPFLKTLNLKRIGKLAFIGHFDGICDFPPSYWSKYMPRDYFWLEIKAI